MTDADLVVIGAGVAGLVIARDVARAGRRVVVCEASDHVGGLLRRGTLAGLDLDLGAESFATRTDAVRRLADELGLERVTPRGGGAHLAVATENGTVLAPLPRRTVLGIPADPRADDVVRIIGAEAARRAEGERSLPRSSDPEPSLFRLVAERCGPVVARRLVDPLCRSIYSTPAEQLRLSALHPGFWREFEARGSLTAAAGALATAQRAGAAVAGIAGGMWRLPAALDAAVRAAGAEVRTGVVVRGIAGDVASGFEVLTSAGILTAREVVIATGPAALDRLLGAPADAVAPGRVRIVAAAVDNAGLDAFPVGSGVIVDPALPTSAKALTHITAKWAWADAASPAGRHLVRLSARDADAPGLSSRADVAREVTTLTGVVIDEADVVDMITQEWPDAVAGDARDAARAQRIAVAEARGIRCAGAAPAGTGLASVVPHAQRVAAAVLAAPPGASTAHLTRSSA